MRRVNNIQNQLISNIKVSILVAYPPSMILFETLRDIVLLNVIVCLCHGIIGPGYHVPPPPIPDAHRPFHTRTRTLDIWTNAYNAHWGTHGEM